MFRARGEEEALEEWLLCPKQRLDNETELEGSKVKIGRPSSLRDGQDCFDIQQPPELACFPFKVFEQLVVRPEPVTIRATAKHVWDVMMDFESYSKWNRFQTKVQVICKDETQPRKLRLHVNLGGKNTIQDETIFYVDQQRFIFVYGITTITPSFRAQWLSDNQDGTTTYNSYDIISGHLTPIIRKFYEHDILTGFQQQHEDLKQYCQLYLPQQES
eukprot:CAMPEP_0203762182 /NCGR_PEP_ID=MMETSP0098-20131031/15123_1 /ASSEMBLY_ACC=CAM_ASM_000208 /TAXON_ID=96639 /ORGANISM=" , Strain NY0313808BC1" /LENGTH=215 /DNA_ID=CAMNT_0050656495 /DNA_START=136 /DNA_END=783 /DNA_ORIENTATION=+